MIGKRLNKNILAPSGALLLPEGTILSSRHLELLRENGVPPTADDIEDVAPIGPVLEKAVEEWRHIFRAARNSDRVFLRSIAEQASVSVRAIAESYDLQTILSGLLAHDDYTYRHSVAVSVLSTVIGKWMGYPEDRLRALTVSSLLHDIGKAKVPPHILAKTGRLTPEEYEIVKKHTTYGYELILKVNGFSQEHAICALQHHERMDGTGYPFGLKEETHPFSRIVAVADVFHAMLSKRPYKEPSPFYQVVKEMHDGAFGRFDPEIVGVFSLRAMEALIGNEVRLSNGQTGRIVRVRRDEVWKPLVQCGGRFVDLSQVPSLHIERV
ncbi:HD-GYP domain-containing protein [Paenibacillus sp.]|uniref:HD-GYP domain-containing protein n=1 Tax=Paenibacillus sp. TaxID=58172 RepID=UPI002D4BFA9C|nr:HD-GYP domain-containing protein [Paenibacillus sp.]HZG58126.1 HD-GYP domain-containing protein [Paenibacillus sp.]